jgi:SAM-dependent methyltransferase
MDAHANIRERMRQAYDNHAQEREASTMQDWKLSERDKFLCRLQREQKKTLLEIGAGTGKDGQYFQEHGLAVTCVDLSPVMVALCVQKGLNALVMDSSDLRFPEASFDAVYAMNSLLHLPKAELPAVLRRIDGLLKPGGVFFLGVYGGYESEGIWEKDSYRPQRFFSFFTDEELVRQVEQVFDVLDFHCVVEEPGNLPHFQSLTLRVRR